MYFAVRRQRKIDMTKDEVLSQLEEFGVPGTKNIYIKHGAKEPVFGVKVADLKKILKKTKKNHDLSQELYNTGNTDAMYLAGLMADEKQISKAQLQDWVDKAYWYYLSEYTVPWIAAETEYGIELGLKWIESKKETEATAGWATLAYNAALRPDEELDLDMYSKLLDRAEKNVHTAQNRVRYVMNGFVISVGTYVKPLTEKCLEIGERIGKVSVEMGGTSCKVPLAKPYLQKQIDMGRLGKKRKTARC